MTRETIIPHPTLPAFDYARPATLDEAILLLREHGQAARPMLGGTDLLVRIRDGVLRPRLVVDLKGLPGMTEVRYDPHAGLTIGAAVTMNQLASHPDVRLHYPLLAEAARSVASYPLRNRATIGGNLCNSSPAADTGPAALVLQARLLLYGPEGAREVAAADFFLGPGRTALRPGELLTSIRFPPPPPGGAGCYLKLGRNRLGDLSIVGVAVLGYVDETAPSGCRFRIGLASVAPTPLRATGAEETLAAAPLDAETLARAARQTAEAASPIDDVRASAAYRREMTRTLTLRGLNRVWQQLRNTQYAIRDT